MTQTASDAACQLRREQPLREASGWIQPELAEEAGQALEQGRPSQGATLHIGAHH